MMQDLVLSLLRRQEEQPPTDQPSVDQLSNNPTGDKNAGQKLLDLLQNPFRGPVRKPDLIAFALLC